MASNTPATTWTLAPRPVTVADYRAFCKATGREWAGPSPDWQDDWPANLTTWHDATDYCEWRTTQGHPCRLPTEAEWVAGTPSGWTVGDECRKNGRAVWEWTADLWDDERPDGPRVLRGGSWIVSQIDARAASRGNAHPVARSWYYGFRVVVARAAPGPLATGDSAPATPDPMAGARAMVDAAMLAFVSAGVVDGDWPRLCLGRAFVNGFRWWEWQSTGATAWPTDRDRAEAEADVIYGAAADLDIHTLAALAAAGLALRDAVAAAERGPGGRRAIAIAAARAAYDAALAALAEEEAGDA